MNIDGFEKFGISNFVHCNPLNLQALKFYFCAFCAFLRLYRCQSSKIIPLLLMINNSPFKESFNITFGVNTNAKMKGLDTGMQWGYR